MGLEHQITHRTQAMKHQQDASLAAGAVTAQSELQIEMKNG
jgi:hypothetical protein